MAAGPACSSYLPQKHQWEVKNHERIYYLRHSLAPHLDFLRATPEWQPLASKHANLGKWLDLMNSRPSMAATTWERVNAMARAA